MSITASKLRAFTQGEIVIAIIGLLGVIGTAALSNWEKLFPKQDLVRELSSGYRPTGDFETEFRHYVDVSGVRKDIELTQKQMLSRARMELLTENPSNGEAINRFISIIEQEAMKVDDQIRALLPIYQKHITISELQELNQFYSSRTMQIMVQKTPLIAQDSATIEFKMLREYVERVRARVSEEDLPAL